MKASSNTF